MPSDVGTVGGVTQAIRQSLGGADPGSPAGGHGNGAGSTGARGPGVDRNALEKAVGRLNQLMTNGRVRLSFRLHEGSGRMMVRVIEVETGEVLREVPPEEFLDTIAAIRRFVGLLLDRRA